MTHEARPEVVERLLAILDDDTLLPDERIARVFADDDATAAERYAAARVQANVAHEGLVEAGLVDRPPAVVHHDVVPVGAGDATMRQMQSIADAWGIVSRYDASLNLDRRLSDVRKVIPPEDNDAVTRALRWGGFR